MSKPKHVTADQAQAMFKSSGYDSKMHRGELRLDLRRIRRSRRHGNTISLIINYYEKDRYVCTIHRVVSPEGHVVHEDIKGLAIGDVHYIVG